MCIWMSENGMKNNVSLSWKPCRVVHCYKIVEGISHIVAYDGIIKLNKTATVVWEMADGKHKVEEIVTTLSCMYEDVSIDILLEDVLSIIQDLVNKGIMMKDWDPLLKDNINYKEKYEWIN